MDKGFERNEPVDVVIRPEDIDIVEPAQGHLTGTVTSATIGSRLTPEDIHIMKKSEYSGQFGAYSSHSAEYDELTEDADNEEE